MLFFDKYKKEKKALQDAVYRSYQQIKPVTVQGLCPEQRAKTDLVPLLQVTAAAGIREASSPCCAALLEKLENICRQIARYTLGGVFARGSLDTLEPAVQPPHLHLAARSAFYEEIAQGRELRNFCALPLNGEMCSRFAAAYCDCLLDDALFLSYGTAAPELPAEEQAARFREEIHAPLSRELQALYERCLEIASMKG